MEATLDEAMTSQRGIEEVKAYFRLGLKAVGSAQPKEWERIFRGLIDRVRTGRNESFTRSISLGIKIPLQLPSEVEEGGSSHGSRPGQGKKRSSPQLLSRSPAAVPDDGNAWSR